MGSLHESLALPQAFPWGFLWLAPFEPVLSLPLAAQYPKCAVLLTFPSLLIHQAVVIAAMLDVLVCPGRLGRLPFLALQPRQPHPGARLLTALSLKCRSSTPQPTGPAGTAPSSDVQIAWKSLRHFSEISLRLPPAVRSTSPTWRCSS